MFVSQCTMLRQYRMNAILYYDDIHLFMAKVPESARNVERPEGTVVVYRSSGIHAVKTREYVYDENGVRHCVDGPVIGHIINGSYIPDNGIARTGGRVDSKEWANVELCVRESKDVFDDLLGFYSVEETCWIYVLAILRCVYPGMRDHQVQRKYSYSYISEMYPGLGFSKNTVCTELQNIGMESNRIRDFMRMRVGTLQVDEMVVIDGSLQQDESTVNSLSKRSRKYREVKHRQYVKMYAYSADRLEPVCSKIYPGNMTDSRSVGDFIRTYRITKGIIVADKGFPVANMEEAVQKLDGVHYILPLKDNSSVITEHSMMDFDDLVPKTAIQSKKVRISKNVWLYSFRDPDLAAEEESDYVLRHTDGYEPDELKALRPTFGTIVFQSDLDLSCARVHQMYEGRWLIELLFKFYSSQLDLDDTREHNDYSVTASNFVDFLSALMGTRMLKVFDTIDEIETWSYEFILDFLRCMKKCRVDGDVWENERYNIQDSEILVKLGLLEKPVVPLEPPKKKGRPKGSKDRRPRKPRTPKASKAAGTASHDTPM